MGFPYFRTGLGALGVVCGVVLSGMAQAASFSFALSDLVDGSSPTNTLTMTVTDTAAGQVELSLGFSGTSTYEFVSNVFLSFDGEARGLTFTQQSGGPTGTVSFPKDNGFGFDFAFEVAFPTKNNGAARFNTGESAVYLVSGEDLTASLFNAASLRHGDDYTALAHIQGIGTNQSNSAWVGGAVPPVPLPSAVFLFVPALAGLYLFGRGRKVAGPAGKANVFAGMFTPETRNLSQTA
ncbi:MAG: hypothetical protein FD149_2219 [Rhodospirillaceae bacterium]|nr:MAG: hypothetical protein FD149_2219 [Rhodospirillaceae bacterium]